MDEADLVRLLRGGVEGAGPLWADLGSGDGAFTLALASLLGAGARIWSVDRDARRLDRQRARLAARFPFLPIEYRPADFTEPLGLPPLDGIVIANALHFVRRKAPVVECLREMLRPGGRLVLVEYNADSGNPWVPHPVSFPAWERLAAGAGLESTRLLERVPSRFLREIYSAVSLRPTAPAS